ncbi:MAG: hypothetical protein IPJ40_03855 [Saprospirales bacterium]|nr:hypothetical protein [Saprospirales bacterium]
MGVLQKAPRKRYNSQRELALSFLALVDLAFLNDPFIKESEIYDIDDHYENSSLPYRFGKIVYRAQGISPLQLNGMTDEEAVVAYQDSFCKSTPTPNPVKGLKRMAVRLIGILTMDLLPFIPENATKKTERLMISLFEDENKTGMQLMS